MVRLMGREIRYIILQNTKHYAPNCTVLHDKRLELSMPIFVRIFYHVEIKCQLDATEVFIANLIACSTCFGHHHAHHQELKSIIQWLLPVVFRAVVFQVAGLVWS